MSADINQLSAAIKPMCQVLVDQFNRLYDDVVMRVTFTYRSPELQDQLKKAGRTTLSGEQSKHCHTLEDGTPAADAFDVAIFKGGEYLTDGTNQLYKAAGLLAETLGLTWGGRFVHPRPDYDHFEI